MFKVGDKVVRTIGHNVVFEVSGGCIGGRNVNARKNGEVYTDYISTTKGMPHRKSQLRHATPEEIAAGHRIDHFVDANEMVDCEILDRPEDYTSPNCKKFDERVK